MSVSFRLCTNNIENCVLLHSVGAGMLGCSVLDLWEGSLLETLRALGQQWRRAEGFIFSTSNELRNCHPSENITPMYRM